ncbi:MAG: HsdM family class I SAM-dependent methyltransferase, partial [Methylobacter sp.]
YKRLSDNYFWEINNSIAQHKARYDVEPNDKQKQKIIADAHDFKIPEGSFWEDVRKAPQDKKNKALDDAVNAIAEANVNSKGEYFLKGIINSVRWNEPAPDGSGGKKLHPEVLTSLVNYLDAVDLSNANASVDILGDAYEYLIKKFADENKGGTMAGQFYTPSEVVDIIVRYLKPTEGETVYDPTCGSGGFLINAAKYVKETTGHQKKIRIFGQEDVWNTWAIANINMVLHGLDAQVKKGDTLKEPKYTDPDNELAIREFDIVMANFPFSVDNWWKNGKTKKDSKGKPVTKKDGSPQLEFPGKEDFTDPYQRFRFGIPPFSNGDFAFVQHIVASLDGVGRAGVVCPQGVLFRGQPEKTEEEDGQNRKADDEYLIRRGLLGLVEQDGEPVKLGNIIDAIVVLPSNLFYGTTIPGSIVFFNKNKPAERKDKVLMIYAAKPGWYKEEANLNVLMPHDVLRISTLLEAWGDAGKAKDWIDHQKNRLYGLIEESLSFKLGEIEREYAEDIALQQDKLQAAQQKIADKSLEGKQPTKAELNNRDKAQETLQKLQAAKLQKIADAEQAAARERLAIDAVQDELTQVFADPELRKRYFSVVDMAEIEENEFNLNIPRYVDTFEPEEKIDLKQAIEDYKKALTFEEESSNKLNLFINLF